MYCEARHPILLVVYVETALLKNQGIILQVGKTFLTVSQTFSLMTAT